MVNYFVSDAHYNVTGDQLNQVIEMASEASKQAVLHDVGKIAGSDKFQSDTLNEQQCYEQELYGFVGEIRKEGIIGE